MKILTEDLTRNFNENFEEKLPLKSLKSCDCPRASSDSFDSWP